MVGINNPLCLHRKIVTDLVTRLFGFLIRADYLAGGSTDEARQNKEGNVL